MEPPIKRVKPLWILLPGACLAILCVWQAGRWTYESELTALQQSGEERLALYAGSLDSLLTRMENLPYVMAHNDAVARMLIQADNQEQLNRDLESLNYWAGTGSLFLLDAAGEVVASSAWRQPVSFLGENYAFRPYFTAAREGHQGRFFAIGLATNQPGLFMSHGVSREGKFLGAVVVKAELASLIKDWRDGGERVLISDANRVIILSSKPEWTFKTLTGVSARQRKVLRDTGKYGGQVLDRAPFHNIEGPGGAQIVRTDGQQYLLVSRRNPQLDWTLTYLAPLRPVLQRVRAVWESGTILALLILALGMFWRERRQKKISRRKLKEAEGIKQVNLRLQEEIEEHRRTEQALRDAQAELVQSSKLAALGQMAAGIVHELNQPIAAIRTHAASGRLLLERQDPEPIRKTLADVSRITEHMASITSQLKIFSHKAPGRRENVVFQTCLDSALTVAAPLLEEVGVVLDKDVPDEAVSFFGSRGQVQQVLVNLIHNGVDAMRGCPRRVLSLRLTTQDDNLEFQVRDTGSGIAKENLEELFNPFFTTKEVGQGLGLGLSISYRIVTDLGGSIRATNGPDGGAVFSIRLPLADEKTGEKDD